MKRPEGENFSIVPSAGRGPSKSESGVISGETSGETSEVQARQERRFEGLKAVEATIQTDAQLSALFDGIDDANPLHRVERLVEAINDMRRDLEGSDSHPDLKRLRGRYLSDIANRLRELL